MNGVVLSGEIVKIKLPQKSASQPRDEAKRDVKLLLGTSVVLQRSSAKLPLDRRHFCGVGRKADKLPARTPVMLEKS